MARWRPLLIGPQFEAEDKAQAEARAGLHHGPFLYRVISQPDLDEDRREQLTRARRKGARFFDSDPPE